MPPSQLGTHKCITSILGLKVWDFEVWDFEVWDFDVWDFEVCVFLLNIAGLMV